MENLSCREACVSKKTEYDKGKQDSAPDRERWSHKADGIISLLAYTVGEGTVLKFPYLCARNGGGAFLVPFLVFTLLCALPNYYLELLIGQYTQRGPVEVWRLCPALKGLGLGSALVSLIYASYTSAYFSWYAYYLFYSFFPVLPWSTCDNPWNTRHCFTPHSIASGNYRNSTRVNDTGSIYTYDGYLTDTGFYNITGSNVSQDGGPKMSTYDVTERISQALYNDSEKASAADEFWRLNVLKLSDGLESLGELRWPLVGWLSLAFICMYLILFSGVRVSGKIVYVTFFCPIILLTVLFIRALTLPGATDGLLFYIRPDFAKLKDLRIWLEACMFALYSMGTGTGCIITSASRNKFRSNCFSQSLILVFGDALITIYCGFAIFTFLGHLAWMKGVSLEHFQSDGFNIAFMVFPEAVTYLPLPQLWSVMLFITFMTLGMDTTVPSFEVVITVLSDQFPGLTKRHWLLVAMVMLPLFLLTFLFVTQGGIYLIILVDWFSFGPTVLVFSMVQLTVLGWVFGAGRLEKFTKQMYDRPIPWIFKILIKFITPLLLLVTFIYSLYGYRPPKYSEYFYPEWATAFGWCITAGIVLPLPFWMVVSVSRAKGDSLRKKVSTAFKPAYMEDTRVKENTELGNSLL